MEANSFSNLKKTTMKTPSSSENTKASSSPLAMSSSSSPSQLSNASLQVEWIKPTSADAERLVLTSGGRLFPPPITLLRTVKEGQSYACLRYNMNDNNFIVEDIKIPQTEILRACRKDGRLRLYFAQSFDEGYNDEEENVNPITEKKEAQNNI